MSSGDYNNYVKTFKKDGKDEYELEGNDALYHSSKLVFFKKYEKCIELLDCYLKNPLNLDIKNELLNNKAYALYKMKNNVEALKVFYSIDRCCREILEFDDTKANIYCGLGYYDRALDVVTKMITPKVKYLIYYPEFLGTKAKIINKLGLYKSSILTYCECIYRDKGDFRDKYKNKIRKIGWKMPINYIFPKNFKQIIIFLLFTRKYSFIEKLPNELIITFFKNLTQLYIDDLIEEIIRNNYLK